MSAGSLQELSKGQAIELAQRMKAKARNIRGMAEKVTQRAISVALSTAAAFGLGYWMGGLRAEREELLEKAGLDADTATNEEIDTALEENGGDPTKWFGIDKDLVVSVALAGVAITGIIGAPEKSLVAMGAEAIAVGGMAGWAYGSGADRGFESYKKVGENEAA